MKKFLLWFFCMLAATLLATAVTSCVKVDKPHMTEKEAKTRATIIGVLTAGIYFAAISTAIEGTKSINKARKDKETQTAPEIAGTPAPVKTRTEADEPKRIVKPELQGAVAMLPVPGLPDYGECPQCHTRNHLGRNRCFGCGLAIKTTLPGADQ